MAEQEKMAETETDPGVEKKMGEPEPEAKPEMLSGSSAAAQPEDMEEEWESFQHPTSVSIPFLIYRGFFLCAFIFMLIHNLTCSDESGGVSYYLLYLTHWSLITQTIYGGLFFGRVVVGWIKYHKSTTRSVFDEEAQLQQQLQIEASNLQLQLQLPGAPVKKKLKLHWVEQLIWVLVPTCFVYPFVVSLGFWGFVATPEYLERADKLSPDCYMLTTSMAHGLNAVAGISDFFIIAVPIHITHAVYLCIYGLGYIIFTGIYELMGGTYPDVVNITTDVSAMGEAVYAFLNWKNNPGGAFVASIVGTISASVLYMMVYASYALRLLLVSYIKPSIYEEHWYEFEGPKVDLEVEEESDEDFDPSASDRKLSGGKLKSKKKKAKKKKKQVKVSAPADAAAAATDVQKSSPDELKLPSNTLEVEESVISMAPSDSTAVVPGQPGTKKRKKKGAGADDKDAVSQKSVKRAKPVGAAAAAGPAKKPTKGKKKMSEKTSKELLGDNDTIAESETAAVASSAVKKAGKPKKVAKK